MVKVHLVGGPGSGKTTLGQAIAAKLHIRHQDLDWIDLAPGHGDELAIVHIAAAKLFYAIGTFFTMLK